MSSGKNANIVASSNHIGHQEARSSEATGPRVEWAIGPTNRQVAVNLPDLSHNWGPPHFAIRGWFGVRGLIDASIGDFSCLSGIYCL